MNIQRHGVLAALRHERGNATLRFGPAFVVVVFTVVVAGGIGSGEPSVRASEPVHAYLSGETVVHYSLEVGPRAWVRRVVGSTSEATCRVERFPHAYHLPVTVWYPIRIKEADGFLWSLWPAEKVDEFPEMKRHRNPPRSPLPKFPIIREDLRDARVTTAPIAAAATAELGAKLVGSGTVRREYCEEYPVNAMFLSQLFDLEVADGVPRSGKPYPVEPTSPKFAEWSAKLQPEFARFGSYDLLPGAKGSLRLFLVMQGSKNRRYIMPPAEEPWMYELEVIPEKAPSGQWAWRMVDDYASEFVDRFHVVESAGGRWFVSGDQRLYRLSGEKHLKGIRGVPVRDKQAIHVLLEEPGDKRRAFAFTADRWFELKEPLEYHEFALGRVNPEAPLPLLLKCAAEVRRVYPALPAKAP